MKKILSTIIPALIFLALLSCASSKKVGSPITAAKDGAIEYTKASYINMLSLNPITAGMQRIKSTYSVTSETGYTKFSYNFEMTNSSKIVESYRNYCSLKGGKYMSSDWTVGLCSKTDSVADSLFFVTLKPVKGFSHTFRYVNLWVLEPTGTAPAEYERYIRLSGYLSPDQVRGNKEVRMEMADAARHYDYMRTIGSKVCKKQVSSTVSGVIERVEIDRIQLRTEDGRLMWVEPSDWKPC